jgi:hypothetical protein
LTDILQAFFFRLSNHLSHYKRQHPEWYEPEKERLQNIGQTLGKAASPKSPAVEVRGRSGRVVLPVTTTKSLLKPKVSAKSGKLVKLNAQKKKDMVKKKSQFLANRSKRRQEQGNNTKLSGEENISTIKTRNAEMKVELKEKEIKPRTRRSSQIKESTSPQKSSQVTNPDSKKHNSQATRKAVVSSSQVMLKCSDCRQQFNTRAELNEHKIVHKLLLQCPISVSM